MRTCQNGIKKRKHKEELNNCEHTAKNEFYLFAITGFRISPGIVLNNRFFAVLSLCSSVKHMVSECSMPDWCMIEVGTDCSE